MIDIDLIRKDKALVVKNLGRRGITPEKIDGLIELDTHWRAAVQKLEEINQLKNEANSRIAGASGETKEEIISSMAAASVQEKEFKMQEKDLQARREALWKSLPNLLMDDVPRGKDESENKVIKEVGEKPLFDFEPQPHEILGENLGLIDIERAAKVSGSRFAYLKGDLVFLEFALVHYVLSVLTSSEILAKIIKDNGLTVSDRAFIPILPPVLIKEEAMERMARLEPREERYHMHEDNLYLVGSAEHTLGALHMDEVLTEPQLPLRYIGFSPAFRREAGSYGKDTKGILRMHQFDKLEMESFSSPVNSLQEQNLFVAIQEHLLASLGIPYRVVMVCAGDMGTPDARQIDLEAWMPGQNQYRETHTADLMTDYQARRLKTRIKTSQGKIEFAHMNDATALACGRTIIAIMENYQQADGSITMPEVLHPYLPFQKIK
ncbi:MAG: serine--tRNA ligase [Candidatus Andersenbacteria bacterium]|nr:serine--tRNA ligase [Candidatus Andersenbacteria bacterium]